MTAEIHELTDANVKDQMMLRRYRESVDDKEKPPTVPVTRLYEEVGVVFSDAVRRELAETKRFREQIIANRREFLATEIKRLGERIAAREREIKALSDERAEHLDILKTHGALEEMTRLQERVVGIREKLERVTTAIGQRRTLEAKKREIKMQRGDLEQVA